MDTKISLEKKFWLQMSTLAFFLVLIWSILLIPYFFTAGEGVYVLNILAGTSGILLAMSFSLSSFAYYFDFLDSKLVYRKYLGLMGYFFALAYALIVAFLNPIMYIFSFPYNLFEPTIGLAIVSIAILTLMALISNKKAIVWLGPKNWKTILGFGYIAYAFLVIRAILLDDELWSAWFQNIEAPFTVRMFLTALGILVLCFRASVPFHQKFSKIDNT